MDVDHPAGEVGGNGEEMEESGHDDEVGGCRTAGGEDRLAPGRRRLPLPRQDLDRDTGPAGDVDAADVRAARDDEGDRRRKPAGVDLVEKVFERPPRSRKQDGETTGGGHALPPGRRNGRR